MFEWLFGKKEETRSVSDTGYTAQVMSMREAWINGQTGLGELTATVQGAVSLWENSLGGVCI